MTHKIKCTDCRFPCVNKELSNKKWTAYVCGNYKSEYYKTVLNITGDGRQASQIVWLGCKHGERRVQK